MYITHPSLLPLLSHLMSFFLYFFAYFLIQYKHVFLLIPNILPTALPLFPSIYNFIAYLFISSLYFLSFGFGVYVFPQCLHLYIWLPALVFPAFICLSSFSHLLHFISLSYHTLSILALPTKFRCFLLCRFTIDVLQKDKKTSDEWEILCYS